MRSQTSTSLMAVIYVLFSGMFYSAAADSRLDRIVQVIERNSRGNSEMDLLRYFHQDLARAYKKAQNSPNGGPDFPWWFPRPSYKNYKIDVVRNDEVSASVIIARDQGGDNEKSLIEYVLRSDDHVWKIYDVVERPILQSDKQQSLRRWLNMPPQ